MNAMPSTPGPKLPSSSVQALRTLAIALLLALIALGLAWELWLAPTGRGTLAIKLLPLPFAAAGLRRHRLYTYRWLSLLVWVYVGEGLLRATSEHGLSQALAIVEALLGTALFAVCAAYIRLRLRRAHVANPAHDGLTT